MSMLMVTVNQPSNFKEQQSSTPPTETITFNLPSNIVLSRDFSRILAHGFTGREAVEVAPILDALPNLEQ